MQHMAEWEMNIGTKKREKPCGGDVKHLRAWKVSNDLQTQKLGCCRQRQALPRVWATHSLWPDSLLLSSLPLQSRVSRTSLSSLLTNCTSPWRYGIWPVYEHCLSQTYRHRCVPSPRWVLQAAVSLLCCLSASTFGPKIAFLNQGWFLCPSPRDICDIQTNFWLPNLKRVLLLASGGSDQGC